jgi:hypothetical protein
MFDQSVSPVQVAHDLRASTKSAYQWRGGVALAPGLAAGATDENRPEGWGCRADNEL